MESQFKQDDGLIQKIATGALASGEVVRLADGRAGIVQGLQAVAIGDSYALATEGIFSLNSASATTFSEGDPVVWDASANAAVPFAANLDGSADFYCGRAVKAKTSGQLTVEVELNFKALQTGIVRPFVFEFDTETDTDPHTLIPAWANPTGLLILGVYGLVTEVFAGGTQDQGIVTIKDTESSPNTIGTLTPSDGGADALNDVIVGTGKVLGATTGDAVKVVAASKGVTGTVTQAVSGTSAAGKMKVFVLAMPLA